MIVTEALFTHAAACNAQIKQQTPRLRDAELVRGAGELVDAKLVRVAVRVATVKPGAVEQREVKVTPPTPTHSPPKLGLLRW